MAMTKQDKNDAVISALGHPIRRKILRYLEDHGNGSPKELSRELGQQLPNVSYHVRILAESGVLKLVKTTPRRGALEHHYARAGNALDQRATEMLKFIGKD